MRDVATVRTADLEAALDYMEGLALILQRFHEGGLGKDGRSELLDALMNMDSHGMNWEPLRYQHVVGQGWSFVAENIDGLRDRLLEGYADAAL